MIVCMMLGSGECFAGKAMYMPSLVPRLPVLSTHARKEGEPVSNKYGQFSHMPTIPHQKLRTVKEAYAWITSVKVLQHANTKAVSIKSAREQKLPPPPPKETLKYYTRFHLNSRYTMVPHRCAVAVHVHCGGIKK